MITTPLQKIGNMASRRHLFRLIAALLITAFTMGCSPTALTIQMPTNFQLDTFKPEVEFASPEILKMHEANLATEYRMGPGDEIRVQVWNRDKLSGEHVVGPFGEITLPMLGDFIIGGKNRSEAAGAIVQLYRQYYDDPIVTIQILKYMNNKVYVLGRVSNPGVIHFAGSGTLLEALSLAGGLPTQDKTIFLSKCYVIRGKDQIIWIDLLQLLQKANARLNLKLANNDIIYIPESTDAAVFVMGEIRNPGSYQVQRTGLSLMDALNLAGGPTEDGDINNIRLIRDMRNEKQGVVVIDLDKLLARGDFSDNYLLQDNDILYIPKKGIAKFNYYLRQIDPFLRTFISGTIVNEAVSK